MTLITAQTWQLAFHCAFANSINHIAWDAHIAYFRSSAGQTIAAAGLANATVHEHPFTAGQTLGNVRRVALRTMNRASTTSYTAIRIRDQCISSSTG